MSNTQININANGTTTLATAGKYCDRNIDVNVDVYTGANDFTNILQQSGCTIALNKVANKSSETDSNGDIVIYLDLVTLGFNTHPAELTFRWRGMWLARGNTAVYLSTDNTTWTVNDNLFNGSNVDAHGDVTWFKKINYPTSNRYVKFTMRVKENAQAVTQEDVDKCILTINEAIGNTIEGITPSGNISITANGSHDVTNYETANVNVPNPSKGSLEITANGTYDVTEKASAVVNVPASGITPTGTKEITSNGTHDVTNYANARVNVPDSPTQFTNVLKHASTSITLNTAKNITAVNSTKGYVTVEVDLVSLGFTTHPANLEIRWRGMAANAYPSLQVSTDKSTWSATVALTTATIAENGDYKLTRTINYPTSNRYLRMNFMVKGGSATITQEDVDKCILTFNEIIGNGGYVG